MSTSLAIAAATAALRNLLQAGIPRIDGGITNPTVTLKSPDKARDGVTGPQLNLYLYHMTPNSGWRNADMPSRTRPGEMGAPPLALNLHYVLTAFGKDDTDMDAFSHRVLGSAMAVLHDHPVLGADELKDALEAAELHLQAERVRITPQTLSLDEMSKLWTSFQTPYRLSAAIQASVLLIDSRRPTRAAVPVLKRGADDSGAAAASGLENPFPHLDAAEYPAQQPGIRLGETLTLRGGRLAGTSVRARFQTRWWTGDQRLVPVSATDGAVEVAIPNAPATWPAGVYAVSVLTQRAGETYERETNQLPVVLCPRIAAITRGAVVAGVTPIQLQVTPDVRPEQSVSLLLGDREVPARPRAAATDTLDFDVASAAPGPHWVRVRIDGADSLLVQRNLSPPEFDPTQQVTIP